MNAKYAPGAIVHNEDINVCMAVALDGGLITPTLKRADGADLVALSLEWKRLVASAKAGTLKPDEYTTGTFAISNLGMFNVDQFDAILPTGMGAILAVSSAKDAVVPMAGALMGVGVEKQMTVTITCDHRIISGADAALFLADFAANVEAPAALLGDAAV